MSDTERFSVMSELPDDTVEKLRQSFKNGPIVDDQGRKLLEEHSVAMLQGLKIEIFSNEHPPPHFRVSYSGETNNFRIDDCSPLNGNALKKWFRNIKAWHQKEQKLLTRIWNDTRPSDCTVGKIDANNSRTN
jgi:hypothetical protein